VSPTSQGYPLRAIPGFNIMPAPAWGRHSVAVGYKAWGGAGRMRSIRPAPLAMTGVAPDA
jgi:hypothetical protein